MKNNKGYFLSAKAVLYLLIALGILFLLTMINSSTGEGFLGWVVKIIHGG